MRPMQHTIGGVPPATVIHPWPASYRGWGIFVGPLPDGRFVGMAEGGYRFRAYADAQQALEDVTAWIDRQEGR